LFRSRQRLLCEPPVADLSCATESRGRVAADEKGNAVRGLGQAEHAGGQVVELRLGRARSARPAFANERDPLVESSAPAREGDVERVELLFKPPGADTEPQPS